MKSGRFEETRKRLVNRSWLLVLVSLLFFVQTIGGNDTSATLLASLILAASIVVLVTEYGIQVTERQLERLREDDAETPGEKP